jgi:hypothetical protein
MFQLRNRISFSGLNYSAHPALARCLQKGGQTLSEKNNGRYQGRSKKKKSKGAKLKEIF